MHEGNGPWRKSVATDSAKVKHPRVVRNDRRVKVIGSRKVKDYKALQRGKSCSTPEKSEVVSSLKATSQESRQQIALTKRSVKGAG